MIKAQAASSKYGVNMTNDEYMKAGNTRTPGYLD